MLFLPLQRARPQSVRASSTDKESEPGVAAPSASQIARSRWAASISLGRSAVKERDDTSSSPSSDSKGSRGKTVFVPVLGVGQAIPTNSGMIVDEDEDSSSGGGGGLMEAVRSKIRSGTTLKRS